MASKEEKKQYIKPTVENVEAPEPEKQEEDVLDKLAIPYVETENEHVPGPEKVIAPETQVTFKFNKNVRLGKVRLNKGDCIEIDGEDAKLFVQQKHGEIV